MITLFGVPYSGQNGLRTARSEFPWERRGEGRERRDIAIRRGMPREMREREKTITMNYWPRSMNERKTWEGERVKLLVAF